MLLQLALSFLLIFFFFSSFVEFYYIGSSFSSELFRSDVYSYGVILWELVTEKIPWDNLNSMQVFSSFKDIIYSTHRERHTHTCSLKEKVPPLSYLDSLIFSSTQVTHIYRENLAFSLIHDFLNENDSLRLSAQIGVKRWNWFFLV